MGDLGSARRSLDDRRWRTHYPTLYFPPPDMSVLFEGDDMGGSMAMSSPECSEGAGVGDASGGWDRRALSADHCPDLKAAKETQRMVREKSKSLRAVTRRERDFCRGGGAGTGCESGCTGSEPGSGSYSADGLMVSAQGRPPGPAHRYGECGRAQPD